MPGLVVYAMGNPFRRQRRVEYVYGPSSAESIDPYAPLVNDEVYDNEGIVLVADIYSVWPEVGAFPHSQTYSEVVEKLEAYMTRTCSLRLTPRLCRRVAFIPVPWRGLMGGWRFTGTPGDTLLAAVYGMLARLGAGSKKVNTVYYVLDDEEGPAFKHVGLEAAKLLATLLGANLKLVAAEPKPYPMPSNPVIVVDDVETIDGTQLLRMLIHSLGKPPLNPLQQVTPRRVLRLRKLEKYVLTIASALMATKGYLIPLFYQACGARNPISKTVNILDAVFKAYMEATELSKKPVGGILRHHLSVNPTAIKALIAGAAIESRVLDEMRAVGVDCEEVYSGGVPKRLLERLEENLMVADKTPHTCLAEGSGTVRLREGCLRRLRESLLV